MSNFKNTIFSGNLSAPSIDEMSREISSVLETMSVSSKDILRIRLSAEDVLRIWALELGEDTVCRLLKTKRFGKTTLILQTHGRAVDPTEYTDELLLSVSNNPSITSALGIPAEYRYQGGYNELFLCVPGKKASSIRQVTAAIILAVIISLLLRIAIPNAVSTVTDRLIGPLMNTFTDVLCLISGPLVFLSVFSGISGVGDALSFGKISGRLTKRFLSITLLMSFLIWLSVCWLFPIAGAGDIQGNETVWSLFQMILDIIPGDIVSPFQSGNAMQIIFIAICMGIGTIILCDSVPDAIRLANQINAVVQLLMKGISTLLPAFIFLSISDLVLSSSISELSQILIPFVLISVLCAAAPLIYGAYASIMTGTPLIYLLRSQYPCFITALATASSAAVFSINIECCEKKFNIDEKLVKFGIPFGQVIFKLGTTVLYMILSLYLAEQLGIPITPSWIATLLMISSILSFATPPLPGAALSGVVVLFSQLGIPASAVRSCAAVITFTDYAVTACNIACLQQELLINAKKLNMLRTKNDPA